MMEKECLVIKGGIKAFHVYLLGRPFTIQTTGLVCNAQIPAGKDIGNADTLS